MDPAERVGVCEVDRLDKDGEITAGQDADLPSALTGSGLHGRQSLSGRLITDVAFGDKQESKISVSLLPLIMVIIIKMDWIFPDAQSASSVSPFYIHSS